MSRHRGERPTRFDDMESLYYVMLHFAGVELPWEDNIRNKNDSELANAKNKYNIIRVSIDAQSIQLS